MYARALGPCMPSVTMGIRPYAHCHAYRLHMYARALAPSMPSVIRGIRPYAPYHGPKVKKLRVKQGILWFHFRFDRSTAAVQYSS